MSRRNTVGREQPNFRALVSTIDQNFALSQLRENMTQQESVFI